MPIPREHSELRNALGCALFDPRLVDEFAPYDRANKICDAIAPEGRVTRKGILTAAFKGSGEEMNYPIYDALNNEDAEKLGMKKGTEMAICNYRCGKNNRCFLVGCFVPDEEGWLDIPTRKEVIEFAKKGFPNSRYSTHGESQFSITKSILDVYHGYVVKQFYTSDEAVMAAEAPKVKKRRPNMPNVPPQPTTATPILDPDQKELNEEEIANLKVELKEQVESRKELDLFNAKKMKRLKELGEDKNGVKRGVVNMHYILSENKAGKVAVSIYAETMTQVMGNDSYRHAASENFLQAFEDMVDVVVLADSDPTLPNPMRDAQMDALLQDCPTNVKEPYFSRWG
jgi:hypothetical protein